MRYPNWDNLPFLRYRAWHAQPSPYLPQSRLRPLPQSARHPKGETAKPPPADFYRKKGDRTPKHNHQPVPRYQCKACGKQFSATWVKPIYQQHRPDLNGEILKLAASGVGLRRIALLLGCAKQTVQDKVSHLAFEAEKAHQVFLARLAREGGTTFVQMDELETFIHAQWAQVSVPVVVRVKTGQVLGFGVAKMSSKMKRGQQMGWTPETRFLVIPRLLDRVFPAINPNGATIKTDGGVSYGKWIARHLP